MVNPGKYDDSEKDRGNFLRERICLLLKNTKTAFFVNVSIAILAYLAIQSPQSHWLGLVVGVACLRLLYYLYANKKIRISGDYRVINTLLLLFIFLQGCSWGAASVIIYTHATVIHKFYLIAIVCGMSGGSILTLAPSFTAFICFTLPAVSPLVTVLLLESDKTLHHAGLMGIIFIIAVHLLARRIHLFSAELLKTNMILDKTAEELSKHRNQLEKQVEERTRELADSRESYRRLAEEINVAIYELDSSGTIVYISPVITSILGHKPTELTGTLFLDLACEEDAPALEELFSGTVSADIKPTACRLRDATGDPHWVRISGQAIFESGKIAGYRGVLGDIEQEKQAEDEKARLLERSFENQKLEAIATLAGGVAHEFNNLLMIIQGHASLMAEETDDSQAVLQHRRIIEKQIRKAKNLTSQLLGTARRGKYNPKPLDLNDLATKSAYIFERTQKNIHIQIEVSSAPLVIEADSRQIEQVLLNLFLNAVEAMPQGGKISLTSEEVLLKEPACQPYLVSPGRFARFSVSDEGVGMDGSTQKNIFNPFFTTKKEGLGTGLGLAAAYGIVKNHGGFITVESEPGKGSTFNLYLPISEKHLTSAPPPGTVEIKGSETILLVDDEELILNVGRALLERLGYTVITADGGKSAVEIIKKDSEKINLVILDMIMPEMDGGMTFDEIRALQPNMPVLLSSGYSLDGYTKRVMDKGCNGFLQKPFNKSELSHKVREILDFDKPQTRISTH